jgi:hypothetical protein
MRGGTNQESGSVGGSFFGNGAGVGAGGFIATAGRDKIWPSFTGGRIGL